MECVAERGLAAATMTAVAERAGVTVGAIQHQFTDKEGLRSAVLEHGLDRLAEALRSIPATGNSLNDRVQTLVDELWSGYREPDFRAMIEILRSMREADGDGSRAASYLEQVLELSGSTWRRLFPDVVDEQAVMASQRLVFGALNGLALEQFLLGEPVDQAPYERAALADAVTRMLQPPDGQT